MKFEIINQESEIKFEPFKLIIEVESLSDLANLYSRFNLLDSNLKYHFTDSSPIGLSKYLNPDLDNECYKILKEKCKEIGFKFNY